MPRILLLLLLFFHSFAAISQDSVIWKKTFGYNMNDIYGRCIGTRDGGYLLHGQVKRETIPASAGGLDWGIYKLDSCGNTQWEKIIYPNTGTGEVCTAQETADGSYILAGHNSGNSHDFPENHGIADAWVFKLDHNGNILWRRNVASSANGDSYYCSVLLPDGSIILGGWYDRSSNPTFTREKGRLTRLDQNGNTMWDKIIDSSVIGTVIDICVTPENKLIACGFSNKPVSFAPNITEGKLAQFSLDGQLEWNITMDGPNQENLRKVVAPFPNIIYLTGFTRNSGGYYPVNHGANDIMLYKFDGTGHKIWGKLLGGSGEEEVHDMKMLNDSTLILAGHSGSADGNIPSNKGLLDVFVLKADTSGNIRECTMFGGSGNERASGLFVNKDRSFMISGFAGPTDILNVNGIADIFIAKFKNIPYNKSIDTFSCVPAKWNGVLLAKDTSILEVKKDICGNTASFTKHNFYYRPVELSSIKDTSIDAGAQLFLSTRSNAKVIWKYSPDLSCLQCLSPIAHPNTSAIYKVTATNEFCTISGTVNVYVKERKPGFFVPSAFSPNHDGINDVFRVFGNAKSFSLLIFNRWGQPMFSSTQISKGWNGEFAGSRQPAGAYTYIIRYRLQNDIVDKIQTGQTLLLR